MISGAMYSGVPQSVYVFSSAASCSRGARVQSGITIRARGGCRSTVHAITRCSQRCFVYTCVHLLCKAESRELEVPIFAQQEALRLQIAMRNALAVHRLHGHHDLRRVEARVGVLERAPLAQVPQEWATWQMLEHEIQVALILGRRGCWVWIDDRGVWQCVVCQMIGSSSLSCCPRIWKRV